MFLISAIFSVFIFALSCQVASFAIAVAVAVAIACFCVFLESFSVPRSPTSATAAAAAAAAEGTVQRFFLPRDAMLPFSDTRSKVKLMAVSFVKSIKLSVIWQIVLGFLSPLSRACVCRCVGVRVR